jgi:hypothetical protein
MSANIKASVDGTQAIIGVGGVDQMTVSNLGVVTANSFVGAMNSSSVTATGSTTARTLANRFGDVVNVKDFGAIGDGASHPLSSVYSTLAAAQAVYPFVTSLNEEIDWAAIQAAIDVQKGPVFLPNGIYLVSSEIVIKDGTGIIGENPFWKRRTGYVYTGDKNTVIKYVGAGGTNSCVIRASKKAVGVEGTNFGPTGDDLINIQLMNFHIDSNGLAEYGCYMYRAGNCGNVIDKITCEKSTKANHVHLGCYAAKFGVFGAYQGEDHGVICGVDIFSWNSPEATNFAYSAQFLTANNGTSVSAGSFIVGQPYRITSLGATTQPQWNTIAGTTGQTYVVGSLFTAATTGASSGDGEAYLANDSSNSGGTFSVGRGSNVVITSEGNKGRACILSQRNSTNFAGGSTDYVLEYLEGNGDGPYIDYRDGMDAIRLRCGFIHPGNGTTLLPQNIKIEGKNNSGVVTPNSGPSTSSEWLVIDGAVGSAGDISEIGFDIDSNTFKYNVINCTERITYSDKTPAVTRNTDNLVNAGVYFTASSSPAIWKAINGTLTRTAVGVYLFTFLQPFKTAGAVIPQVSIIVDVGAPYDTKVRIQSISTTSINIRTYDAADNLADTGDRISVLLTGALQ